MAPTLAAPLNETVMAVRPRGDLIALAFRWNNRLRIHSSENLEVIRSIAGPAETFSLFGVADRDGKPALVYTEDTALTYVDVTADNNVIVALYSARDQHQYGYRAPYGRELHVFSWDGRLVRRVTADIDLLKVRAAPERHTLYGLARREDKRFAIVAFDMNTLAGR